MWSLLLLSLSAPVKACPTVATGTPNALPYDTARVAIVRQGQHTVFTVSVNPAGAQQDFALLMPVPGLLAEDDVRVVNAAVFQRLEGQTGILTFDDAGCFPPDYHPEDPCPDSWGDGVDGSDGSDGSWEEEAYGDVAVEAEYRVGTYDVVILSATDSTGLFAWLTDHGYHVAEATVPVLQSYLDEGMMFLTARVNPEAAVADGAALTPLQIAYDSDVFGIPIRLAAASSPGEQDMLIYALTDPSDGRVGISNYPEIAVEDSCIWNAQGSPGAAGASFIDFYAERFNGAWTDAGRAAWAVEWSGANGGCNPCSGVWIDEYDRIALGFQGGGSYHLTRLHMRYTALTATRDLMLYGSGMGGAVVTTFANDNTSNRWCKDPCQAELVAQAQADRQERQATLEQAANEAYASALAECLPYLTEPNGGSASRRGSGCDMSSGGVVAIGALFGLMAVARRQDAGRAG